MFLSELYSQIKISIVTGFVSREMTGSTARKDSWSNKGNVHDDKMLLIMPLSLENTLSEAVAGLGSRYGIIAAYLYGSHARAQARPGSDVDIALLLANGRERSAMEMLEIGRELENSSGLKHIDVRFLNDAPLAVKGRILAEGKLLYSGNDDQRVDFEVKTRSLYFDFLPHHRYLQRAFVERAAERGL
ncbi:MAG: nucleotidyltransferase domain-containing protein [Gaiellales bacterium]|nr:MAG: nucleotidyltransferase domain-containing protein [Gaiellales bacterium]